MNGKLTKADKAAKEGLDRLDAFVAEWVEEIGWREQLDMLAHMSSGFAGPRRIKGPGGAELKMLILRQRSLIDRWVKQAYLEGTLAGMGKKFSDLGRAALKQREPM